MTCIVGLEDDGDVVIGGDSAGSWQGPHDGHIVTFMGGKVFGNSPFLIGYTWTFRMGQLLRYAFTPAVDTAITDAIAGGYQPGGEQDDAIHKYMATKFVDQLRECLKKGGMAKRENEVEAGGEFMVGVCGRLYEIGTDYSVDRTACGYNAVGSGARVAMGSLYTTSMPEHETGLPLTAHERVLIALRAAEEFTPTVRGPFSILTL